MSALLDRKLLADLQVAEVLGWVDRDFQQEGSDDGNHPRTVETAVYPVKVIENSDFAAENLLEADHEMDHEMEDGCCIHYHVTVVEQTAEELERKTVKKVVLVGVRQEEEMHPLSVVAIEMMCPFVDG